MSRVKFKDLSGALKVAVILAYIMGGISTISFLIGFISVLLE